ncbi:MAG: alanine racemase [Thermodesulfobacteriota bacterium]|nr:alanine racemase [Thermodesulfobacteriota bacterium]
MSSTPLIWAEIDLRAVARNIARLKTLAGDHCELMAVVKANAYGHGMCQIADTALANGAASLGVARIEEALALRDHGIKAPVLVFGYTPTSFCRQLCEKEITPTVFSLADATALSQAATACGKIIRTHLKVDTGMGRLGLDAVSTDAAPEIIRIARRPGLALEGIYTHFASADSQDKTDAENQLGIFRSLLARLEDSGVRIPVRHAANSAALITMPEARLDMVRTGLSVYGLYPADHMRGDVIALEPAMALKTRIVQLKTVCAGFKVSYGSTYKTPVPTTLAVVPVGYADGYNRLLSSRGEMLVSEGRVPVVGRVCMDLTVLDVGHIGNVQVEDEVVVFGRQGDAAITADEIAETLDTINYEIVSTIPERVPRIFLK